MLSVQTVFVQNRRSDTDAAKLKFAVEEGDHITLLNVYDSFIKSKDPVQFCQRHHINFKSLQRAKSIRIQLKKYLIKFKILPSSTFDIDEIRKCILTGYFSHAAKLLPDGTYAMIRGNRVLHTHPSSVLFKRSPNWVCFHEVVETSKAFMRDLVVIEPAWLTELAYVEVFFGRNEYLGVSG